MSDTRSYSTALVCGAARGRGIAREQRRADRLAGTYNAALVNRSVSHVVEIEDFSTTGARVVIRTGLLPTVGHVIRLTFMNGSSIDAAVVWSDGLSCGLQFHEPIKNICDYQAFDELGADLYRSILQLQLARGRT